MWRNLPRRNSATPPSGSWNASAATISIGTSPDFKLTSLNPQAKNYPWFVIINGGAANFYEFFVHLKNRPGFGQYLAQKLNVMIVTIPGNFRYGGWDLPLADPNRQPAYVLDRDLSIDEYAIRNAIFTNSLITQGLKALVQRAYHR